MRRRGPEHQRGWRETIEVDGHEVVVMARHHTRGRPPRGHEIARQAAGGGYRMVEETTFEWTAAAGTRNLGVIRENMNGTFSVGAFHAAHRTVQAAAAWAARRVLPAPPACDGSGGGPAP